MSSTAYGVLPSLSFFAHCSYTAMTKRMLDTYTFCLRGFRVLAQLHVEVNTRDITHVLSSCATWSSERRLCSDAVFDVVIYNVTGPAVQLIDALEAGSFSSILCTTNLNSQRSLKGRFQLSLRSPDMVTEVGRIHGAADAFLCGLRASDGVHAAVGGVQWLY